MTFEQIMTIIAENTKLLQLSSKKMEESDQRLAESDRRLAESKVESDRQYQILKAELAKELAEARRATDEARRATDEARKRADEEFAETRRAADEARKRADEEFAETRRAADEARKRADEEFAETRKKTADELAESRKSVDREIKRVSKQIADLGDSLGKFAEEQVRPRLIEMFREKGVYMEEIHGNIVVERNGQYLLEIDLLLVNTVYSVVVEVKHNLKQKDVDEHIERLEKLQLSPSRSIKGTKMYGAVAGMIVNKEVERYAIKKGFYLVKPKGDSVEISNATNFKAKTWDVQA